MVTLSAVQFSNSKIFSLTPGLVAVFVGATSGIGMYTLKEFVKDSNAPKIYFVGRSQDAGSLITKELKALNSQGEYKFIKADVSLIKVVDDVCRDIKSKESAINLLVLSQGTLVYHTKTTEGLHMAYSLTHYSRHRFIVNLLPLLQQATALCRVVSVLSGTYEGTIDEGDLQGWKVSMMKSRGHGTSTATLWLEGVAQKAPTVTFINAFPGAVDSGIMRGTKGPLFFVMKIMWKLLARFITVPKDEVGARHTYLSTSARYPPAKGGEAGVPLGDGIAVAKGVDGELGSGVYSVDQHGESSPKTTEVLAKYKKEGMMEKVWNHHEEEWVRITGTTSIN